MSTINSTNLSELTGLLNTLKSAGSSVNGFDISSLTSIFGTGNFLSSLTGSSSSIGNLLSGAYSAAQGLSSDDTSSQINGLISAFSCVKEVAQKLESLIASNEAAKAAKEAADNTKKNQDNKAELVKLGRTNDNEIDKYIEAAEDEVNRVNEETSKLDKVNDDIEAKKKDLEAEKQTIQKQVEKINNPETDDNDRNEAIKTIKNSTANILGISADVLKMTGTVDSITQAVTKSTQNIATQMEGAQYTLVKNLEKMKQQAVTVTTEGAETTVNFATHGAANEAAGTALEAAAATEAAFVVTAPMAAQTEQKALDQFAAGGTRLSEVGKNMTALGSYLSEAGNEMSNISSYATTIGEAAKTATEAVGAAMIKIQATIASIGSWESVAIDAGEVNKAIPTNGKSQKADNNSSDKAKNTNTINLDIANLFKLEVAGTEAVAE